MFTIFFCLDLNGTVSCIGECLEDLTGRRLNPEIAMELFCGISISVTDLECDGEFILCLERFVETLLSTWRKKGDVSERRAGEEGEQCGDEDA